MISFLPSSDRSSYSLLLLRPPRPQHGGGGRREGARLGAVPTAGPGRAAPPRRHHGKSRDRAGRGCAALSARGGPAAPSRGRRTKGGGGGGERRGEPRGGGCAGAQPEVLGGGVSFSQVSRSPSERSPPPPLRLPDTCCAPCGPGAMLGAVSLRGCRPRSRRGAACGAPRLGPGAVRAPLTLWQRSHPRGNAPSPNRA